jgi:hypothetical protein
LLIHPNPSYHQQQFTLGGDFLPQQSLPDWMKPAFDKLNERDKDILYHVRDIIQNNCWRLLVENQKKLIALLLYYPK